MNMTNPFASGFSEGLRPLPDIGVGEWAERNRVLDPESAAEPGRWRNSRVPYMLEPMIELGPKSPTRKIVLLMGAQVSKTELLLNFLGYIIDINPGPTLFIQPTDGLAKDFSKSRVKKLITTTASLAGRVSSDRGADADNSILNKSFKGGRLLLRGANAPAGLASVPIENLLCDEVDRWTQDAGGEGCPLALAEKRTLTYSLTSKTVITSTPKDLSTSRVHREYEAGDRRRYFVPCPLCRELHLLEWENVIFEHTDYKITKDPVFKCPHCNETYDESKKYWMIDPKNGARWIAENPDAGAASFFLNGLYSPWNSLKNIVKEFLEAKKSGDLLKMKTWINTILAKAWDDTRGTSLEWETLKARAEDLSKISNKALVITSGVDVQDDRLEAQVVAWAEDGSAWVLDNLIFYGDPARVHVWNELETKLGELRYMRRDGVSLPVDGAALDTGGHHTSAVYSFVKTRIKKKGVKYFAIKGSNQPWADVIATYSTKNKFKVPLNTIGTDTIKEQIFYSLKLEEDDDSGNFYRFSDVLTETYFKQLTAEKLSVTHDKGKEVRKWIKQGERNEALDTLVYAVAAKALLRPVWSALRVNRSARKLEAATKPTKKRVVRSSLLD